MLKNLGQIGTKEFLPQPVRLAANERHRPSRRTGIRNWGDAIKVQRPLSSSKECLFAFSARVSVRSTRSSKALSCWSTSAEKIASRSWRRKR